MAIRETTYQPSDMTSLAVLLDRIAVISLVKSSVSSVELTQRDRHILKWIAEQYTVRFDTLQKLLGRYSGDTTDFPLQNRNTTGVLSDRNTRRQINRWKKAGLAEFEKFHKKQKGWVFVTPKGLKFLGLPYSKRFRPTFRSRFGHYHVLNELRLAMEDQYGDRLKWVKTDRQLHFEFERLSRREKKQIHVVDSEITIDGQLIAIQVELSRKTDFALSGIVFQLRKQYQQVWYFVNGISQPGVEKATIGSPQFGVYHIADYGILEADQREDNQDKELAKEVLQAQLKAYIQEFKNLGSAASSSLDFVVDSMTSQIQSALVREGFEGVIGADEIKSTLLRSIKKQVTSTVH